MPIAVERSKASRLGREGRVWHRHLDRRIAHALTLVVDAGAAPPTCRGHSADIGTPPPGCFADIIAMPGNPPADIARMEKIDFAMNGGQVVVAGRAAR